MERLEARILARLALQTLISDHPTHGCNPNQTHVA
jgi:hypothetical protein